MAGLDDIRIGSPCPMEWGEMAGDERVRYCGECRHNVYDISSMTRLEAENLLKTHEGRLCVRLVQRPDGKIMTRDCPRGAWAVRRRLALSLTTVAAVWLAGLAFVLKHPKQREPITELKERVRGVEPFKTVIDKIDPPLSSYPPALLGRLPSDVNRFLYPRGRL